MSPEAQENFIVRDWFVCYTAVFSVIAQRSSPQTTFLSRG